MWVYSAKLKRVQEMRETQVNEDEENQTGWSSSNVLINGNESTYYYEWSW